MPAFSTMASRAVRMSGLSGRTKPSLPTAAFPRCSSRRHRLSSPISFAPRLAPVRQPARFFSVTPARCAAAPVRLTAEAYDVPRDGRFGQVTAEHVSFFKSVLDPGSGVIDGVSPGEGHASAGELEGYNVDWMRKYAGQSRLVLRPSTTAQVSEILRYCNEHRLAVVPQGGNTGLVGGSVPVHDEIVVSLSRMNKIKSFDPVSGILVAEAGVVLEAAEHYLAERGFAFPLDLGAKGSCQLGGNVATNAGGVRVLRYGSLHGSVLGLEAVLPDGRVVDDLGVLRKNNTGYDLKQLFIGSEGTVGIITAVSVLCPARPRVTNVALLALDSYENAVRAFGEARRSLSEILTAFELMDGQSQRLVGRVTGDEAGVLDGSGPGAHPFYCLIETGGSNEDHDGEKVAGFLEHVLDQGIVADGTVAQDMAQAARLWALRERITECAAHWGGTYKYDVSVPVGQMYELVEATRARLAGAGLYRPEDEEGRLRDGAGEAVVEVVGFGHMGDSNLHLNVAVREYRPEVAAALEPWVYEWVRDRGGSISAEHGLGFQKRPYIRYARPAGMVGLMRELRAFYDPNGIMNPYKYV